MKWIWLVLVAAATLASLAQAGVAKEAVVAAGNSVPKEPVANTGEGVSKKKVKVKKASATARKMSGESETVKRVVGLMADNDIVTQEDLKVYGRQSRESPLSELVFDVMKELISRTMTEMMGPYFGVETKRTSDDDGGFNIVSMVMEAVRKSTLQKRMGCPT